MLEKGIDILVAKELLDLAVGEGKLAMYGMKMANGVSMGSHKCQPTQSRAVNDVDQRHL